MKHISPSLVAVAAFFFLIAAEVVADESSDVDRERPSRGPQLPPPLRIFDEDGDNALSPEEITKLTERLSQLDQDGDGRVDPRELEGFFGSRRPPRRGDDRDDRRPDAGRRRGSPGRGDGRFDRNEFDDRDDQFDRRPNEGRRRGPPGRGDDRFDREDFDREDFDREDFDREDFERDDFERDDFERDDFERDDFDDRFDRRPDGGRRQGPPGRGDDRFERDQFGDDFDERGRPPSEDQRRRDNDNRPRGEAGTGTDRLIERLYRYDANGDGKLSADELPVRAKRLIEQADRDQDGSLDREELEIFLSSR